MVDILGNLQNELLANACERFGSQSHTRLNTRPKGPVTNNYTSLPPWNLNLRLLYVMIKLPRKRWDSKRLDRTLLKGKEYPRNRRGPLCHGSAALDCQWIAYGCRIKIEASWSLFLVFQSVANAPYATACLLPIAYKFSARASA